ncbi:MAG TPA: acyloxyacyl hydrolase [Terracidiphilus sp.]
MTAPLALLPQARQAPSFPLLLLSVLLAASFGAPARAQSAPDSGPPVIAANPPLTPAANADLPDAPDAPRTPLPSVPSETAPAPVATTASAPLAESSSTAFQPDFSSPFEPSPSMSIEPGQRAFVPLNQCPYDKTRARECRIHWTPLIIEASVYTAAQNAFNLYSGYWYRWETTHGKWMDRWFDSVTGWRWDHWEDNNPFLDDYIGHPMMGAITNYMWIQNDPKGATVDFGNNRVYWKSRMRALAFTTAFSLQWKFGPFGEASIGHNGDHFFVDKGVQTNETGWVELVTTPVGGLAWTMAEDAIDKHLVRKLQQKPHRVVTQLGISFLTPSKATANILRFRPPWYRDAYVVKANTFWSDPPGTDGPAHAPGDMNYTAPDSAGESPSPSAVAVVRTPAAELPEWPRYGGKHEFGAWWGLSLMTGHIWGYAPDVKYMPIDVNYSYLLNPKGKWNFRYAPEITALAMLDEINPTGTPRFTLRKRSYGSGISPVGFRASFLPDSRVQPFVSGNGGFIYFNNRVLSPQGSQFMYTIDYGAGLTFFRKKRQSVSLGYRYQHLSNANISHHNPGTDANTFYLQVSRYRSKGYR